MKKFHAILCLMIFVFTSCSKPSGPTVHELPVGTPLVDLEIQENSRSGHTVYFDNQLVAEYASVPDIIELRENIGPFKKGTWLMYFNDTRKETENELIVAMAYSIDEGSTWSDRILVPLETEEESFILADVSILELEDGTLRLYFYALEPTGDIGKTRKIYSAVSNDGLSFTMEALVYETPEQVNNPEVVYHDGLWYLFLTIPQVSTGYLVSDNPLYFEGYNEMEDIGILGADSDGENLYVYGCSDSSSEWLFEKGEFVYLRNTGFEGCDPAPHFDSDGVLHMATKVVNF